MKGSKYEDDAVSFLDTICRTLKINLIRFCMSLGLDLAIFVVVVVTG